jgi:outer membrane scaffolding protein for murein synthesis (MipA/OmpV family)
MTPTHSRHPARHPFQRLAACALLLCSAGQAAHAAEEKPLWEAGIGVATVSFPAYRGSDQRHNFLLPTPYFVYRGEFFKADRDGVRAQLFDSDRVELTFSAALSPPASSDDIRARAGMPDLKANFELGPQLNLTLWRTDDRARQLKLLLPLRAAFTLEKQSRSLGWVVHPKLNLDISDLSDFPGWNLGLQVGPLFGDRKQHDYFYGVDTAYATSDRPAYAAGGGFAGMQAIVGVSKRYSKHWVGAFLRYDNLSGARFVDSPLVRTRNYVAAGVAVSWILGESTTRVLVDE